MSDAEDEDAFLYGSDAENVDKKTQPNAKTTEETHPNSDNNDSEDGSGSDSDEYESESEDDIQIIVDSSKKDSDEANSLGGSGPEQATDSSAATGTASTGGSGSGVGKSLPGHQESSIDIDAVPMYKGKKLTELDLQKLELKPWRLPGADITDYFNYGFNELTWLKFLGKLDQIKVFLQQQPAMPSLPPNGGLPPGMPMPFMPMPPQFNIFNPMMGAPGGPGNMNNNGNNRPMWNNQGPNNNMNQQMKQMQQQQPPQMQNQSTKSPTPPMNNSNLPKIPGNAKLPQIPKMTPPPLSSGLPDSNDDRELKERKLGNAQPQNYRERPRMNNSNTRPVRR